MLAQQLHQTKKSVPYWWDFYYNRNCIMNVLAVLSLFLHEDQGDTHLRHLLKLFSWSMFKSFLFDHCFSSSNSSCPSRPFSMLFYGKGTIPWFPFIKIPVSKTKQNKYKLHGMSKGRNQLNFTPHIFQNMDKQGHYLTPMFQV